MAGGTLQRGGEDNHEGNRESDLKDIYTQPSIYFIMSDYETLHRQCISLRIDSTLLDQINTDKTTISKALNTDISNTIIGLAVEAKEKDKKGLPADLP